MTIDDGRIDEAIRRSARSHRAALDAHRRATLAIAAATEALTRSRRVLGDAGRRRRPPTTEVLADEAARLRVELAGVRRALESRSAIDQAKGMLMLQRGLTPDEAFRTLVRLSQRQHRPLSQVAAALVARGRATVQRTKPPAPPLALHLLSRAIVAPGTAQQAAAAKVVGCPALAADPV